MKDLKFRAWDKFNAEYYYSDKFKSLASFFEQVKMAEDADSGIVVEQGFTCQKRYEADVYVGDVYLCLMYGIDTHQEEVKTVVEFRADLGTFVHKVLSKETEYSVFALTSKFLISATCLGSIYSNPELLS
jgi:hypothetical protein